MYLKKLEINGFKSFAKKEILSFDCPLTAIVGPNGSGKSNIAESFRWVLGEQSMKSLRGKKGEDLIFNGSGSLSRFNRASVSLTFDNSKKQFPIDFSDVVIERVVYRDGVNEYYINGTQVRLRDIIELLSVVSLGASSHHIISQNQSDRILITNAKERKQMVEDSLGLRIYHWKISEGKRKLEKTKENIKEAQSIRRELSGHLRFLQKETEKIEKTKQFKEDLLKLYDIYLQNEHSYIVRENNAIILKKKIPEDKLSKITKILNSYNKNEKIHIDDVYINKLEETDKAISNIGRKKDEMSRNIGKIEGIIEATAGKKDEYNNYKNEKKFSIYEINYLTEEIERLLHISQSQDTYKELRETLTKVKHTLDKFNKTIKEEISENENETLKKELEKLINAKEKLENELQILLDSENKLKNKRIEIVEKIEEQKNNFQEKERRYFEAKEQRAHIFTELEALKGRENNINLRGDLLKNEIQDIAIIFGQLKAKELEEKAKNDIYYDRVFKEEDQITIRKDIERLKIRVEEVGHVNNAVLKEYKDIKNRDSFLEKEVEDLQKTEKSLIKLTKDLEETLSDDFKKGIAKINNSFQNFFEILFGGGKASISIIKIEKYFKEQINIEKLQDEEQKEDGIDITVNLPRKKIRGLEMLSGGEKALTSIALLFAMTQVKPPPFLILDETDAALDEANSKKYGDMLEHLAKETQLILITHNRETMSRVDVLYGVTMGGDSVSKLLSVKFDEAVKIAK